MSQEHIESWIVEEMFSTEIDQKAEKEEIASELFEEINDIITLLIAMLNTGK